MGCPRINTAVSQQASGARQDAPTSTAVSRRAGADVLRKECRHRLKRRCCSASTWAALSSGHICWLMKQRKQQTERRSQTQRSAAQLPPRFRASHIFTIDFTVSFHHQPTRVEELRNSSALVSCGCCVTAPVGHVYSKGHIAHTFHVCMHTGLQTLSRDPPTLVGWW
jgi:hypothetical protein